eukprot:symbB.v1.2.000892.t1/scaffold51.1/size380723/11
MLTESPPQRVDGVIVNGKAVIRAPQKGLLLGFGFLFSKDLQRAFVNWFARQTKILKYRSKKRKSSMLECCVRKMKRCCQHGQAKITVYDWSPKNCFLDIRGSPHDPGLLETFKEMIGHIRHVHKKYCRRTPKALRVRSFFCTEDKQILTPLTKEQAATMIKASTPPLQTPESHFLEFPEVFHDLVEEVFELLGGLKEILKYLNDRFHPLHFEWTRGILWIHGPGWKQSDAQRYVCDLIHTMDSTWPVQQVLKEVTSQDDCVAQQLVESSVHVETEGKGPEAKDGQKEEQKRKQAGARSNKQLMKKEKARRKAEARKEQRRIEADEVRQKEHDRIQQERIEAEEAKRKEKERMLRIEQARREAEEAQRKEDERKEKERILKIEQARREANMRRKQKGKRKRGC